MYRRKGAVNGNMPLAEADILAVVKYMCATYSELEARQDQSWNPDNFGKVTVQLVFPLLNVLMKMPNLDWSAMLKELSRSKFQFAEVENFSFLVGVYRAAGKSSALTLATFLEWQDIYTRHSVIRVLIRVPKEIYDILGQSESFILSPNDFANSSPAVKEKAAFLATQNLNSMELCQGYYSLSVTQTPDDPIPLREEFRNNIELLALGGTALPVPSNLSSSSMANAVGTMVA
jgi:hypothetical protein